MAANVLANLVAAAIIYLSAIAFGYVKSNKTAVMCCIGVLLIWTWMALYNLALDYYEKNQVARFFVDKEDEIFLGYVLVMASSAALILR